MRHSPHRLLKAFTLSLLCSLTAPVIGWADGSQLTAIHVTPGGELELEIAGEGMDPSLSRRALPNGQYQILISGSAIQLNGPEKSDLNTAIPAQIPAIQAVKLSGDAQGFQLSLTSWQPLQPQVLSNSGQKVVITLVGDHQLPAAVIARQAEEKLKQAALVAAQQRKAEQEKQLAEQARKQVQEKAVKLAQAKAAAQAAEKQRLLAMRIKPIVRHPSIATGKAAIETDWQPTYATPVTMQAIGETEFNAEDVTANALPTIEKGFPRALNKSFTPKQLARDKIPGDANVPFALAQAPNNDEEERAPINPIRLQTPPSGNVYDASAWSPISRTGGAGSRQNQSDYAPIAEPGLRRAWQALQSNNVDSAELALRNLLEQEPDNAKAHYLLGLALLTAKTPHPAPLKTTDEARREQARQSFLKAVTIQPFLPAYLKLLALYAEDNNWADAERLLAKVSPLYPKEAMIWFYQGRLLESKINLPEAVTAYTQALTLAPDQAEAHYRLAQTYLKAGDLNACQWEVFQVLAEAPDDSRCWKLLGYLAEQRNQPQQAGEWYRASLQPDVMIRYGRLLEKQDQPQRAMALYQAVESIAGDDPDLLFNLGVLYMEAQQASLAEAVFRRFISLNANTADPRVAQAKLLIKKQKR